jgi:predicted nucleotidyltransferase
MAPLDIVEKVTRFSKCVHERFPAAQVYLFGSQLAGTARADSDIDVAVVFDRIDGDFLDLSSMLFRMRRSIDSRIEPLPFDRYHDDSGFLSAITKTGLLIV